ncbi:MAG: hypothetical protein K9K79_11285 [Desulfohalobiaceae bacterium]|nr:hypothetical protein [Desulfohalobiaceae bacterium]
MYLKSNDQQVGELLGELQEKIRSFEEGVPEWALEMARDRFSSPLTPTQKLFKAWAEEKGEEMEFTRFQRNPDYIPDPEEREVKAREYAKELVEKYETEENARGQTPLQRIFSEWAEKQVGW